jgi:hypothetical protein
VDNVLVTKVDVNITLDVRFAEDILLTKICNVLSLEDDFSSAINVDNDEIPSAKIEYNVEFVDPIVVDNVLNDNRDIFENVLKFVDTEEM